MVGITRSIFFQRVGSTPNTDETVIVTNENSYHLNQGMQMKSLATKISLCQERDSTNFTRSSEAEHSRPAEFSRVQPSTAEYSQAQPSNAEHSGAQPRATLAHAHQQAWFDPSISITCAWCILMLSFNIFHPLIHCASCSPLFFFHLHMRKRAFTFGFLYIICFVPTLQHGSFAFLLAFDAMLQYLTLALAHI
jgi:hypothetical protein